MHLLFAQEVQQINALGLKSDCLSDEIGPQSSIIRIKISVHVHWICLKSKFTVINLFKPVFPVKQSKWDQVILVKKITFQQKFHS